MGRHSAPEDAQAHIGWATVGAPLTWMRDGLFPRHQIRGAAQACNGGGRRMVDFTIYEDQDGFWHFTYRSVPRPDGQG